MRSVPALVLLAFSVISAGYAANSTRCRCLLGDPCWPSQADFDSLAQQVSQPLLYPLPPAQPCYVDAKSSQCAAILTNWTDGNWRADQPGSMQNTNFETFTFLNGTIDACYLNFTLGIPCQQGSVSVIGVDARTASDVQAAVTFAAEHNLRLVVKSTGHDYLGRSDGRGSFMIWTHHMKNITVHPSFQPTGAPQNETFEQAITVGAGVQWHEAYAAANASGRAMVGGVSAGGSVSAGGGWPLGGGHSALSPTYGLGVDNVLEISLVTANGTLLTANTHVNSDLFWALRGGGGGTFGVVISVTYRTHPVVPVIGAFLLANITGLQPNAAAREAFTELVRITPNLTDAGWGGYTMFEAGDNMISVTLTYIIPNVSWAEANTTILPYLNFVQALAANSSSDPNPLIVTAAFTAPFTSFLDWDAQVIPKTGDVGFNTELGSWLLPRTILESAPELVADTVLNTSFAYYPIAGGAVSRVDPNATGLNPAWRMANVHVIAATNWPEGATSATIDGLRQDLEDSTAQLRALAPESGAYFNEASLFEPDFKHSFFGSHYDALRAIKQVYDPLSLFVVAEGVGSDEWDQELRCRV